MKKNTRYSFFQLFSKGTIDRPGSYKLVIPIIQRDYAQGRDNDKAREVRTQFLNQLSDYIETPFGSHDLDFVYGISGPSSDSSKKKEFVPLDGQQRLTTLFLLHLYLASRVIGTPESDRFFKTLQIKNNKLVESLFSYHTRTSAVEFCNNLVDADNNFSEVFILDETGQRKYKDTISAYIRNSSWFYPDWLQDPTVNGMLTMLDAIDERFNECDHLAALKRLMSDVDPAVTFIFMSLEDYKLTDDLYIKMNSRGKPLTPFENFKAKYEQYIGEIEKYGSDKSVKELRSEILNRGNKIIKTVKENFSFNIDTEWSKLFWDYSKKEIQQREKDIKLSDMPYQTGSLDRLLSETLDTKISRFIKMTLTNQYAIDHTTGNIVIPRYLVEDTPLSFSALHECNAISADGVVMLTRLFELYSFRPVSIMPDWAQQYFNEREVLEALIKGKDFTFPKRFMLYAYLMFRLKFGDKETGCLTEWMRFIYNVTLDDNSIQVISRNTYQNIVSSTNILLGLLEKRQNPSIIELLDSEDWPEKVDFFPNYQIKEEILKSSLFNLDSKRSLHSLKSPLSDLPLENLTSWSEIILKLESHPYFTGQIGFILKMAGISDYFAIHKNLRWSEDEDKAFKERIIKFGRIASYIFDGGFTKRKMAKNALFERAMLAKYPEYLDYNLLNSTNKSAGSNNLLRDLSWKSFLRLGAGNTTIQDCVTKLFMMLDVDNPRKSLTQIIGENIDGPLWRKDMIKYDYLMGKSQNGYFGRTEDGHRILNDRIQFSRGDHEVYSFVLYHEYILKKSDEAKDLGFWFAYGNSNSWSEIPFLKISNGDITVKVKSYVKADDGDLVCHYLWIDSNNNQDLENFLENRGFRKKNETETVYRRREKDWDRKKDIADYRSEVADNVIFFIADLSSFLKEDTNEHQQTER